MKKELSALFSFSLSFSCYVSPAQVPAKLSMPAVSTQTQLPKDTKLEQRSAEERGIPPDGEGLFRVGKGVLMGGKELAGDA